VFHHAYPTYIQASKQAIEDQRPITKAQKSPEAKKKNYTKIKKFSQKIYTTKGYMTFHPYT